METSRHGCSTWVQMALVIEILGLQVSFVLHVVQFASGRRRSSFIVQYERLRCDDLKNVHTNIVVNLSLVIAFQQLLVGIYDFCTFIYVWCKFHVTIVIFLFATDPNNRVTNKAWHKLVLWNVLYFLFDPLCFQLCNGENKLID